MEKHSLDHLQNKAVQLPSKAEAEIESQEKPKCPRYEIGIDREKIAGSQDVPEGMKDWLMRLPERLNFKDPVILIVGENGAGKTSFARAVLCARGRDLKTQYPDSKNMGLILEREEPAANIMDVLTCSEKREHPDFLAYSIEAAEVISKIREWAKSQTKLDRRHQLESISGGSYTHKLSTRQLFDEAIDDIKDNIKKNSRRFTKSIDFVFDEPEQGMDPLRQLKLPEYVTSFIEDGDTLLVPTNNLALYLSDLPRLDLNQPERGVFRPSDFGEYRELKILNEY